MIRVAVVDDHQIIREGFSMILESNPDIEVVLQAENGLDFVDAVRSGQQIDVALLDVRMPRLDGLQATRELSQLQSAPAIIVVTTFEDDNYVLEAIAAGAQGFLLKRCRGEDLVKSVRSVAAGEAVLAPAVTKAVMDRLRGMPLVPHRRDLHLTGRETEILGLIGAGLNNSEISAQLHLSLSTTKSHVSNILAKTQSRDRVRAALLAVQEGLVPE